MVWQAIKVQGKLLSVDWNNEAGLKEAEALSALSHNFLACLLSLRRYKGGFIWEMQRPAVPFLRYGNIMTVTV